jgi:hypothetical protein
MFLTFYFALILKIYVAFLEKRLVIKLTQNGAHIEIRKKWNCVTWSDDQEES